MIESEELKQLLQNGTEFSQELELLSDNDKTAVLDIFNEPLKAMAKAIGKILNKPCSLGEISVDIAKASLVKETLGEEYKLLDAKYKSGLSTFAFDTSSMKNMAGILLETVVEEGEVSETELNAFGEVFSQMTVALANSLAKVTSANISIEESMGESELSSLEENVIQLAIALNINDEINTTVYYYITYSVFNTLLSVLKSKLLPKEEAKEAEKSAPQKPETTANEELEESSATVRPIYFEELTEDLVANQKENMNLLMDLQLQVSVELGKVKRPIKDILQFTQGTIVELDRLAGDNVDVLVSGKIIAKGEVVVVDQNFGVRITKIVLPEKRV